MDDNFLKELQQNSIPREEVLRKQRELELEKQRIAKLKAEAYEKETKEKFRMKTDKIYDEFVGMIKELCIEASRNGLYITRNGKNEIHGFIAKSSNYHLTYDYHYCSYNLACYIKEFSKYNLFRKPVFKYNFSQSLHRNIVVSEKIYKSQQEQEYLVNYIINHIDNIEISNKFDYEGSHTQNDGDYTITSSLNKTDFIIRF